MVRPRPVHIMEEVKIQQRSQTYMDTLASYLCEHCDEKGVAKDSNVFKHEKPAGMDEIWEGNISKGWMVYTTDKSGKVVLDTKENFLQCMEEHYGMDKVVTPEEVRKAEVLLNYHARAWMKAMSIGDASGSGHRRRCRRALITNFSTIPSLQ